MKPTDHSDASTLSPETVLLLHGIKSASLSVVEQVFRMFPNLNASDFTVQNHSVWAYLQHEQFHSYRTNVHHFEPLLSGEKDDSATKIARSQALSAQFVRALGDPFLTAPYSESHASVLDQAHAQAVVQDQGKREFFRDHPDERKASTYSRFTEPESLVPPSLANSPAWLALFGSCGWGEANFKNQLALHFLGLPHAKTHLDAWHAAYGVHPIHQAIKDNNVGLIQRLFQIGVDTNLTVAVSRGDFRIDFPRSSLLSFVRDASVAKVLLDAGADPAKAISGNRSVNLFVHWRKAFNSTNDSDLVRKLPELQQTLATNWNNPDAPIDQLIQSSGKGTGMELKALLRKSGQDVAFKGRAILNDDTPEPTAYASFLALNFPGKKQHYTQAKLLTELLKDKLHEASPSGEPWLFQALTYVKPYPNSKGSKDMLPASFEALGKAFQASSAWKLAFPPALYASGTRSSPPPASDVHAVARLLSHLFVPTQPERQARLLEETHFSRHALSNNNSRDWLTEVFDFSGHTWRSPSGQGDATLSSHLSSLYVSHLALKRDGVARTEHELKSFASAFYPYFQFQGNVMVQRLFGSAHDPHLSQFREAILDSSGSMTPTPPVNEVERQKRYKAHILEQLNHPPAIQGKLSVFSLEEKKAMVSFLLTRTDGGSEGLNVMGRYGDPELDVKSALALALLKSGVAPAMNTDQLQSIFDRIGNEQIRSQFEAAALDARQSERSVQSVRRSADFAL